MREQVLAHDRALADWIEAEALVAALRRSVAAAVERAAERARGAELLLRAGRADAFALGAADAAQLLAQRAAGEERRLEAALREEARLRERVATARAALAAPASSAGPCDSALASRLRCG
jgi:hypothetical protein